VLRAAGRRELAGCGGGQAPISKAEPTAAACLAGPWRVTSGVSYSLQEGRLVASSEPPQSPVASSSSSSSGGAPGGPSEQVTLLPLGAWSRVAIDGEDIMHEAGVLLPGGLPAGSLVG
jgi:hypothetical protein